MLKKLFLSGVLLCLPLLSLAEAGAADQGPIPQQTLLDYLAGKTEITLIDARSAGEYEAGHIYGALSVPFDSDLETSEALPAALDTPVIVYCKSGKRAMALQQSMQALGYSNVRVLMPAQMLWADELPVFNCGAVETATTELNTVSDKALLGG